MIITKLQGGLGNQMFQFALAISTSKKVYLDLDFLLQRSWSDPNFTFRNFELDIFPNISYAIATSDQKGIFFPKNSLDRMCNKLFSPKIVVQKENEIVKIPSANYIYLDGYFQSEYYFADIRDQLLCKFEFPKLDRKNISIQRKILKAKNAVCIHIRRGDYLKPEVSKYHGLVPLSYYYLGIEILRNHFKNLTFFIFSDDYDFVKENFGNLDRMTIIRGNEDAAWKDMALMSFCRHHIIANSSFSWWGAWLSKHTEGIKIAPNNWFNPLVAQYDINDIIPEKWIKI